MTPRFAIIAGLIVLAILAVTMPGKVGVLYSQWYAQATGEAPSMLAQARAVDMLPIGLFIAAFLLGLAEMREFVRAQKKRHIPAAKLKRSKVLKHAKKVQRQIGKGNGPESEVMIESLRIIRKTKAS